MKVKGPQCAVYLKYIGDKVDMTKNAVMKLFFSPRITRHQIGMELTITGTVNNIEDKKTCQSHHISMSWHCDMQNPCIIVEKSLLPNSLCTLNLSFHCSLLETSTYNYGSLGIH